MDETPTPHEQTQANPAPRNGVTVYRPTIIAGLYLLNIVLGFSVLVGVVLAYVWRSEKDTQEWEATHFTYLIRTFWISFVVGIGSVVVWIGAFIFFIAQQEAATGSAPQGENPAVFAAMFGMFGVWLLLAVWYCIRCILSLVKAPRREPMPNPKTWLF